MVLGAIDELADELAKRGPVEDGDQALHEVVLAHCEIILTVPEEVGDPAVDVGAALALSIEGEDEARGPFHHLLDEIVVAPQ